MQVLVQPNLGQLSESGDAGMAQEERAVRFAAMLRQVPVAPAPVDGSWPTDALPVGTVAFFHDALGAIGVPIPAPVDYPEPLQPYLHREVSRTTLARARAAGGRRHWVKPVGHHKDFPTGPADASLAPPDTPVWCSDRVQWLCEYRCYVVDQRIEWMERYDPEGHDAAPRPDPEVLKSMVDAYAESGDAPAGYALDVGVLGTGETALVEINDGYSLGFYGALTMERARAYLGLLEARMRELRSRCR